MKTCRECLESKPLGAFQRKLNSRDGMNPACRDCIRERNREYRRTNRSKIQEQRREHRIANQAALRERNREWREANRDKIREYDRYRYEARWGTAQERKRKYYIAVATQANERRRNENAMSSRLGVHHYQRWSRAEDLIALRADLSAKEAAFMLGRSIESVYRRRCRVRHSASAVTDSKAVAS